MKRIGFVGVPGSGKTSTARALSAFCRKTEFKHIELISEYARSFIANYGNVTIANQLRVTEKQIEMEDTVPSITDLLITDSPIFLGFLYAMEYRNINNPKDVMYVNDLFNKLSTLNINNRYDVVFFLPPILAPIRDGVRPELHFNSEWRENTSNKIKFIFELFPPKKFVILDKVELLDRVKESLEHIK